MGTDYRVELEPAADEWESFVATHPQSHMLQCAAWGELKSAFGWQAERVGLRVGERLTVGALVLYRRLPLGYHLAYVPKGPLVDPDDETACRTLLDALHQRCRARRFRG